MIISVQFKNPDVAQDAIDDAFKHFTVEGVTDPDELEALKEVRKEKAADVVFSWMKYQEYITVEFDTEARTATVVPTK